MKITIFNIFFKNSITIGLKFIFIWQDDRLTFTLILYITIYSGIVPAYQ